MEMHQIRYFLAVSEELNFTRAAEKCHVAQPSLTRAIKLLEEELGGPLFHRERANTHLSELGRLVKPHLEQVLWETQQTKQMADSFGKLKNNKLKLGVMCTIMPDAIIELISELVVKHPNVELEILDASAKDIEQRLISGELEVALVCLAGSATQQDRYHIMPVFSEPMMIVLNPKHRLAGRNAIAVRDLDGECYLERINCEVAGIAEQHFIEQGVSDTTVYRSERDDWVLAMAAAGLGYAFMPESCVVHVGVVARPLIDPQISRNVDLVTVRGRPHSPAVGALVREAMRSRWFGAEARAVKAARERAAAADDEAQPST
ncbi:MAG: LysR family transcriptional regulator [Beijerinckiaceae bacterium]